MIYFKIRIIYFVALYLSINNKIVKDIQMHAISNIE